MLSVILPVIDSFISTEAEYFCKRILFSVKAPEFSLLHKCYNITGFIGLILHVF